MKKWLVAAAAGVAMVCAASGASASTFIHLNSPAKDGSITGVFGNKGTSGAGTFTDTFKFWLPSMGDTVASITTSATKTCNKKTKVCTINPATNIDFKSAKLDGVSFSLSPVGQFEFGGIDLETSKGWQTLTVNYKSWGKGATYSGTIDFTPTPEPAEWALMIGGLLAVGAAVRAHRREDAKLKALA